MHGVYAVEYNAHCLTWDAYKQLIMDSDTRFPTPLPINQATLNALQIKRAEKAYEIIPCAKKKRKRCSAE